MHMKYRLVLFLRALSVLLLLNTLLACNKSDSLFEKMDADDTNIHFVNKIEETETDNVLNYEYFYNGGGVASADFNNDGLIDLYFTANQGEDKLYLNQGNLTFEDITQQAGIRWNGEWKTGVTVVDINNDGWQDIYVSVSSSIENETLRKNKLYINNKNLTFSEKAQEYGLDIKSFTTQTAFFDYDNDGDLDAYVLNHNVKDFKSFDVEAIHFMRDSLAGDKLLQNNQGKFVDVSVKAGIKGNPIGFGLGIHTADLNNDGWQDIYVSNDYYEEDYLYINNQDGTFTDQIKQKTNHVSYFSMGNDVGDLNNDLLPDIITTDMLPEDNKRQKLLFGPDKYEAYLSMLQHGMQPSFMRNMLQLNNGKGGFSEVGQLAGIANTDWSWSVLMADYDNDGHKDVFITNGYLRDYTNMDFMKYYADEGQKEGVSIEEVIKKMPSTKVPNYIFKNNGNLTFSNKQKEWGLDAPIISNGAVYADLDNDGDLEIVTNNLNEPAGVYKNLSTEKKLGNYLDVQLDSDKKNGAKCYVFAGGLSQYQQFTPTHGYQSSMMQPLHFGLGELSKIDSLVVVWNDGTVQKQTNITANQTLKLSYAPNTSTFVLPQQRELFVETNSLDFEHKQMPFNDFSRQILMLQMQSFQGPRMAVADVNNDGLEDVYVGGGKGQAGQLFVQKPDGSFGASSQPTFKQDELSTDTDAVFFDADADGDLDLAVSSGGYEYLPNDLMLHKRLYLNDGKGNFTKNLDAFDDVALADGTIKTIDFDKDGDLDLFVGGASIPHNFPLPNPSRLYRNDKGKFIAVESPVLAALGLVTDAAVADVDQDGWEDLVIVGEWSGIHLIHNNRGEFVEQPEGLSALGGLWQRIVATDIDNDGDPDLVVGNYGTNSQLKASEQEPLELHYGDFDSNGRIDPVMSYYIQGKSYPAYSRDEISDQLVALKKKYTTHEAFSTATIAEILEEFKSAEIIKKQVFTLETTLLINENGKFVPRKLPIQAQYAPVCAILASDLNNDGYTDLVLAGNQSKTRVRIGTIDANFVQIFLNDQRGNFSFGGDLGVRGDVRDLKMIKNQLIVAINNQKIRVFKKRE